MKPKPENLGRCYELVGLQAIKEPDGTVIHGTIQGYGMPPLNHAWWVYPDGSVWEPATAQDYTAEAFRVLFRPRYIYGYSVKEALLRMVATGHYGPWDTLPGR